MVPISMSLVITVRPWWISTPSAVRTSCPHLSSSRFGCGQYPVYRLTGFTHQQYTLGWSAGFPAQYSSSLSGKVLLGVFAAVMRLLRILAQVDNRAHSHSVVCCGYVPDAHSAVAVALVAFRLR